MKLRISQIGNWAFCLQIHLNVSRSAVSRPGEARPGRDLARGRIFSERECAALAWAETLTRLSDKTVPDEAYDAVRRHFRESQTIFLSTAIATINAWNRLGVAFRFAPPIQKKTADKAA